MSEPSVSRGPATGPQQCPDPGERGAIAVLTALLAVVILGMAAIAVDVASWYSEGERLQRAADSAALAGVPYLPAYQSEATLAARANMTSNGYTSAEISAAQVDPDTARPSRLRVTMTRTVPTFFGRILGVDLKTVTRTATADFAAQASMGSPCNVMGNEPPAADGSRVASAVCPTEPNFWSNIAGPQAPKRNGDRYATRSCAAGDSNCSGTQNTDYFGGTTATGLVPGQSYYVYKITAAKSVASMQVQLFDPMFVDVGDQCERAGKLKKTSDGLWDVGGRPDQPNSYVTDAVQRYAWGNTTTSPATAGTFCTGDILFGGTPDPDGTVDFTTTYALVEPTDTHNPFQSSVVPGCKSSFGGFSGDLTEALVSRDRDYNDEVARNFRQWVDLPCSVNSPEVGRDYYLIVRTNIPAGAVDSRILDPAQDASTGGNGHNRFGIRVEVSGGSSSDVAISALERMPIYANLKSGTTNFYLARVNSGNAGAVLTVTFFDTGDASGAGSIAVRDPRGGTPSGCRATGEVRTSPTGDFNSSTCTLSNVRNSNGYNGKLQRVEVPIPDDYRCDDTDPADCWYRLNFTYPAGVTANDTTTWSASLDGDPVRLVK